MTMTFKESYTSKLFFIKKICSRYKKNCKFLIFAFISKLQVKYFNRHNDFNFYVKVLSIITLRTLIISKISKVIFYSPFFAIK